MLEVLSYGAGKQTFAMLLMIMMELLPRPDLIIFADTQGEKPETYGHIETVVKPLCLMLGIEFVTISKGSLEQYCLEHEYNPMPPACTLDWKVRIINMYLKKRYGFKNGFPQAHIWIGISTDEAHRDTPSQVMYVEKTFPLLKLDYSREDCIRLIRESGYPEPVKSGCWYCPHNNTKAWHIIRAEDPERFAKALAIETNARKRDPKAKLPQFGPGLTEIALIPVEQLKSSGKAENHIDEDNCSSGVCMV